MTAALKKILSSPEILGKMKTSTLEKHIIGQLEEHADELRGKEIAGVELNPYGMGAYECRITLRDQQPAPSGRGGRRPGSGAKARGKYGPRRKSLTVRVSDKIRREIIALRTAGVNITDIVEDAIHAAFERELRPKVLHEAGK
jgi:hypothetical protein